MRFADTKAPVVTGSQIRIVKAPARSGWEEFRAAASIVVPGYGCGQLAFDKHHRNLGGVANCGLEVLPFGLGKAGKAVARGGKLIANVARYGDDVVDLADDAVDFGRTLDRTDEALDTTRAIDTTASKLADNIDTALPNKPTAGGSKATEAVGGVPTPTQGQTVYRVYGGDSAAGGASWSPTNPGSVGNYRNAAGLPSGGASGATNTGQFVIEGTIADPSKVVLTRSALPLDGMTGGLPEYIIPKWMDNGAINVTRVSGVNPHF